VRAVESSDAAVLDELLACPACRRELRATGEVEVRCEGCGRVYPVTHGVVDFVLEPPPDQDVLERWHLWHELEQNGVVGYEHDPKANLSVGERAECDAFAAFAQLEGVVLDVGCGPQRRPAYARAFSGAFVGVDPLVGELPRDFVFVRGIAEYLPFRGDAFDRVLFATSLDHALSPERALAEARRVVKPSGHVVLWFGERHEASAHDPGDSHDWYERLTVPQGAYDRFHAVRFDRALAQQCVEGAELVTVETSADGAGNVFMRARKV
jgi:SAM-dependent methyltransferase